MVFFASCCKSQHSYLFFDIQTVDSQSGKHKSDPLRPFFCFLSQYVFALLKVRAKITIRQHCCYNDDDDSFVRAKTKLCDKMQIDHFEEQNELWNSGKRKMSYCQSNG